MDGVNENALHGPGASPYRLQRVCPSYGSLPDLLFGGTEFEQACYGKEKKIEDRRIVERNRRRPRLVSRDSKEFFDFLPSRVCFLLNRIQDQG